MKIGSLVELIDDNWKASSYLYSVKRGCKFPVKNIIYTVRGIPTAGSILLEEIVNPVIYGILGKGGEGWAETSFSIKRFKELMPPIEISIEEVLKEAING